MLMYLFYHSAVSQWMLRQQRGPISRLVWRLPLLIWIALLGLGIWVKGILFRRGTR